MSRLTLRERRLVAIGLLVVAFALLYWLVVAPIAAGFADRSAEREQLTADLQRNARLLDTRAFWGQQQALQRRNAARYEIPAVDAAAARDIAGRQIKAIVAAAGGAVRAIHEQAAPPGMVRLRVDVRLGLTQLPVAIKDIENESPYPIIEALAVIVDPASAAGRLAPMEVRIDLAFYHSNPAR